MSCTTSANTSQRVVILKRIHAVWPEFEAKIKKAKPAEEDKHAENAGPAKEAKAVKKSKPAEDAKPLKNAKAAKRANSAENVKLAEETKPASKKKLALCYKGANASQCTVILPNIREASEGCETLGGCEAC